MAEDLKLHDRTILEHVWGEQPDHFQRVRRVRKPNRKRARHKGKKQRDRVSVVEMHIG